VLATPEASSPAQHTGHPLSMARSALPPLRAFRRELHR